MRRPRVTAVEATVLHVLLAVLGALMAGASRVLPRLRRQITRDMSVDISSDDGVAWRYVLHAQSRTLSSTPASDAPPTCALRFSSARLALITLLSPRRVGRIVEGMNTGAIQIDGNPVLVLYFHGLTRVVAPIGRSRVPRGRRPVELRAPERNEPYATRIVREAPVSELDRGWASAWRARAQLLQLRAADGEPLPPG